MYLKRRHLICWMILRPLVIVFLFIKFGYRFKAAKNLPENFIVLSNHNTDFDPLFVGASFRKPVYFVASEHIARWKNAFKFVDFAFAPIIRYKGSTAASTVKEMLRRLRSGANVGMFAEGAKSWNGITAPIQPSTGKVVKGSKAALVTYRLEGGYFVSPVWGKGGTRRGRINGGIVNIYTAEQLSNMSVEEINAVIAADLHEDAYARQLECPVKYKGRHLAEDLEKLLFFCPECGVMHTLFSSGDTVNCEECGLTFKYNEYGMLEGLNVKTVKELFELVKEKIADDIANGIPYTAEEGRVISVRNHVEEELGVGKVFMDGNVISCGEFSLAVDEISDMAMHGTDALVFSDKNGYYELIPESPSSTLKFYMAYQVYKSGTVCRFN